jgi:hypothetical protein
MRIYLWSAISSEVLERVVIRPRMMGDGGWWAAELWYARAFWYACILLRCGERDAGQGEKGNVERGEEKQEIRIMKPSFCAEGVWGAGEGFFLG